MKTTLCTLYNSLYLDKGLVLLDSLKECASDFELYVLCMDDKCYEVLSDIGEDKLKPIPLKEVENEAMLLAKSNRSMAEYCWTCSSRFIQYIFETFKPTNCTYIDADMYFYHDPQILVDEMIASGKSVTMVPHRFSPTYEYLLSKVGKYCVEFNCFLNNKQGFEVLTHWHNKCLECCSNIGDGIHWGDQKYLDEWTTIFPDSVHECGHPGAGIAPWNIEFYKDYSRNDDSVIIKVNDKRVDIVFFHFQSIAYISKYVINTGIQNSPNIDKDLVNKIYYDYLIRIDKKKEYLKEHYSLDTLIKIHPSYSKSLFNIMRKSSFLRSIWHFVSKARKNASIIISLQ